MDICDSSFSDSGHVVPSNFHLNDTFSTGLLIHFVVIQIVYCYRHFPTLCDIYFFLPKRGDHSKEGIHLAKPKYLKWFLKHGSLDFKILSR